VPLDFLLRVPSTQDRSLSVTTPFDGRHDHDDHQDDERDDQTTFTVLLRSEASDEVTERDWLFLWRHITSIGDHRCVSLDRSWLVAGIEGATARTASPQS
jgi:hypothetical protein